MACLRRFRSGSFLIQMYISTSVLTAIVFVLVAFMLLLQSAESCHPSLGRIRPSSATYLLKNKGSPSYSVQGKSFKGHQQSVAKGHQQSVAKGSQSSLSSSSSSSSFGSPSFGSPGSELRNRKAPNNQIINNKDNKGKAGDIELTNLKDSSRFSSSSSLNSANKDVNQKAKQDNYNINNDQTLTKQAGMGAAGLVGYLALSNGNDYLRRKMGFDPDPNDLHQAIKDQQQQPTQQHFSPYQPQQQLSPYQPHQQLSPYQPQQQLSPYQPQQQLSPYQPQQQLSPYQPQQQLSPYQPQQQLSPYHKQQHVFPFQTSQQLYPYGPSQQLFPYGPFQPQYEQDASHIHSRTFPSTTAKTKVNNSKIFDPIPEDEPQKPENNQDGKTNLRTFSRQTLDIASDLERERELLDEQWRALEATRRQNEERMRVFIEQLRNQTISTNNTNVLGDNNESGYDTDSDSDKNDNMEETSVGDEKVQDGDKGTLLSHLDSSVHAYLTVNEDSTNVTMNSVLQNFSIGQDGNLAKNSPGDILPGGDFWSRNWEYFLVYFFLLFITLISVSVFFALLNYFTLRPRRRNNETTYDGSVHYDVYRNDVRMS